VATCGTDWMGKRGVDLNFGFILNESVGGAGVDSEAHSTVSLADGGLTLTSTEVRVSHVECALVPKRFALGTFGRPGRGSAGPAFGRVTTMGAPATTVPRAWGCLDAFGGGGSKLGLLFTNETVEEGIDCEVRARLLFESDAEGMKAKGKIDESKEGDKVIDIDSVRVSKGGSKFALETEKVSSVFAHCRTIVGEVHKRGKSSRLI